MLYIWGVRFPSLSSNQLLPFCGWCTCVENGCFSLILVCLNCMCLVHLFISISRKYTDTHSKTSYTPWHLGEMKGSRKADTHASFLIVHLCYFCFWRKSFYGGLHSSLPFKNGENSDFLDHSRLLLHTSISRFCVFLLGLLWWDCWPLVTDPVTFFSFQLFFGSFVFSVLLLLAAISVFYFPQFCLLWGSSALYPPITAD